jgi:hypothetical protein
MTEAQEKRLLMATIIKLEHNADSGRGPDSRFDPLVSDAARIVEKIFERYPNNSAG